LKATVFGKREKPSSQRMSIEHSFIIWLASGISVCHIMYRRSSVLQDYEHVTRLKFESVCWLLIRKLKSGDKKLFLLAHNDPGSAITVSAAQTNQKIS